MGFRVLSRGASRGVAARAPAPSPAQGGSAAPAYDLDMPAFVFKLGHYPLSQGGIGAVRSLGRLGVPVYANVGDRWAPLAWSRFPRACFRWVGEAEDAKELLSGLREISAAIGRPAVIIPTDDEAALFVAEHRDELSPCFLTVTPEPDVIRSVSDKAALAATCRRIGVPTPAIACPATVEELSDFLDAARFPVVVKAVDAGLVRTQNVRSTTIVAHRDEAWHLWTGLGSGARSRLIFQEHIPDGEDWFFHGLCDERSRLVVGYSGVKLRSYPAYAGPTSYGRWEANDALTRQVQCLLDAVGYQGVFDLDLRLDRRDGRYKLLDFNPRVGAQFRLFQDEQDVDVLRALHLHLTGRPVPPVRARLGRTYMLETSDPVSLLRYRRDGRASLREWFEEVRVVDEWGWWAGDDLRPTVIAATRLSLRYLRRASRVRAPKQTGEARARRHGAAACSAPGRVPARS